MRAPASISPSNGSNRSASVSVTERGKRPALEKSVGKPVKTGRGFSSLFDYAVRELRFTDAAAQRRIQAMRLCRRHGWVRASLQSGELSMTSAAQLETTFAGAERAERQCRTGRRNVGRTRQLGPPAAPSEAGERGERGHQPTPELAPRAEQCSGEAAAVNAPVVPVASHAVAQDRGAGHAGALLPRPELNGNAALFPAPPCAPDPAPVAVPVSAAPSSDDGRAPQLLPPTDLPASASASVPVPVVAPSESLRAASLAQESSRDDPFAELSPGPLSAAPQVCRSRRSPPRRRSRHSACPLTAGRPAYQPGQRRTQPAILSTAATSPRHGATFPRHSHPLAPWRPGALLGPVSAPASQRRFPCAEVEHADAAVRGRAHRSTFTNYPGRHEQRPRESLFVKHSSYGAPAPAFASRNTKAPRFAADSVLPPAARGCRGHGPRPCRTAPARTSGEPDRSPAQARTTGSNNQASVRTGAARGVAKRYTSERYTNTLALGPPFWLVAALPY